MMLRLFAALLPALLSLPAPVLCASKFPQSNGANYTTETTFCHFHPTDRHSHRTAKECVERIKTIAQESGRFWFGHQWRINCGGGDRSHDGIARLRNSNTLSAIECVNPPELRRFHSLGSRLFRVNTFTRVYLAHLRVVPSIVYTLKSGFYRACDHDFIIKTSDLAKFRQSHLLNHHERSPEVTLEEKELGSEVHANPLMEPVAPFQLRFPPRITWTELSNARNTSSDPLYTLLMVDVGFGKLNYLVVDFPHTNRTVRHYEGLENFRLHQPTPLVLLVFEQSGGGQMSDDLMARLQGKYATQSGSGGAEATFHLADFMTEAGMEDALIGMNWVLVGGDAYAMEKQRLRGLVDNCHSLIQEKLLRDRRWDFVQRFQLSEMDASLSVSMRQPASVYSSCCRVVALRDQTLFADPLSDRLIPSVALLHPPIITSMRSLAESSPQYQRVGAGSPLRRHYVVMKEQRYALLLVDLHEKYLYWLLVDIPSEVLSSGIDHYYSGGGDGSELVANYTPPVPQQRPRQSRYAVFMLFLQPRGVRLADFYNVDHALRSRYCGGHCIYRSGFELERFKQFHRLRLSAVSWVLTSYDFYEASRQIELLRGGENTDGVKHVKPTQTKRHRIDMKRPLSVRERIGEICEALELPVADDGAVDDERRCAETASATRLRPGWQWHGARIISTMSLVLAIRQRL